MIDEQSVQEQPAGQESAAGEGQSPGAEGAPGEGGDEGGVSREGAGVRVTDYPADGGVSELEGDLDELVAVAAKRDEYLALAQRTQADFENYRKRAAREAAAGQERGVGKLAKELLPALDNLDRALDAADQDDPLLQGVRIVRSEFADALARVGVESYVPVGEIFDPALHEAMASVPQGPDGAASGTIVEVYQPGYRLGEQVIRPARVVVAA
jgi:molecular chaperone GrpE